MKTLRQQLSSAGAHTNFIIWINNQPVQQAWDKCPNPEWMLWLIRLTETYPYPDDKRIPYIQIASEVIKLTLPVFKSRYPNNGGPPDCLSLLEQWCNKTVTTNEIKEARKFYEDEDSPWMYTAICAAYEIPYGTYSIGGLVIDTINATLKSLSLNDSEKLKQEVIYTNIVRKYFPLWPLPLAKESNA